MGKQRAIPRKRRGRKAATAGHRDTSSKPVVPPPPIEATNMPALWLAPAREVMLFGMVPLPRPWKRRK